MESLKVRGHDAPYMTSELRELMGERNKMKTLANKTNDPDFFLKYKQLHNKVTKECRVTKDQHLGFR